MPFDVGATAGAIGGLFNTTQAGPAQAQSNFAINGPGGLNEQLGIGQASSNAQANYLRQMTGLQQQALGIQGADLNIQRGALNRQPALIGQQQGVSDLQYAQQIAENQTQMQALPQLHQMNLADIQSQRDQLAQQQLSEGWQYGQQQQGVGGQMATSGASGGLGANQAWQSNRLQHELQAGGPDLGFYGGQDQYAQGPAQGRSGGGFAGQHYQQGSFQRQGQALDRARTREDISDWEQTQQLTDRSHLLPEEQALSDSQFRERFAQVGDQQQQLANAAKQLGISGEELQARLQYGLGQIGMQNTLTSDQLLGQISQVQAGQFSPVAPFLGGLLGGSQAMG